MQLLIWLLWWISLLSLCFLNTVFTYLNTILFLLKTAFRLWKVNNTFHLEFPHWTKDAKMDIDEKGKGKEKEIMIEEGSMKNSGTYTALWFTYQNKLINYQISDEPKIELGETYNPDHLPDHCGNYFQHPKACLRAPSVQICVRYEENIVTKCCLRHPSRCPADYTIHMMVTCQLINILSMSKRCLPNPTLNIQL